MTDSRPVFFFDIDNCLYSKSKRVHDYMTELIGEYFIKQLSLDRADARKLHQEYSTTYGIAVGGLVLHHKIDPLHYNTQVDDALPLESIIAPDPALRKLLESVDRSKVKLWLCTNAYKTHGNRVVQILGVQDMFEGMTYCDYAAERLICKPHPDMLAKAMSEAGVDNVKDCFFVDDSAVNCAKAEEFGWTAVHLMEEDSPLPQRQVCKYRIKRLEELKPIFPQFFKH